MEQKIAPRKDIDKLSSYDYQRYCVDPAAIFGGPE